MSTGQYELPQDSFDDITAERAVTAHCIDLKILLPDLFLNTERVPRLVAQAWRRAADSVLQENLGSYTYRGGTIIDIAFYLLPPAAAQAKLDDIGARIKAALARQDSAPPPEPVPPKTSGREVLMKDLVAQLESEILRLAREGLGVNPGDETVRLWAARVMHDMYHDTRSIPLLPQMIELVAQADISYLPLFDREMRGLGGSWARIASPVPPDKYNTGEIMRQDMAALFSAVVQLYYLRSRRRESMVVMPLHVQTLSDYDIASLYVSFLLRLAPDISSCLAIDVIGLPRDTAPMAVADGINAISNGLRSCFFDMGVPSGPTLLRDPLAQFPTLHACGFSREDAGEGWRRFAEKFVDRYRGLGLKTYLKDVSAPADAEAAQALGFTYVMGSAFGASQRMPYALNKIL